MSVYSYNLLIENYKDVITQSVKANPVTVIKGPTGCGKSTFVPYILGQSGSKIAIIEPRRIAVTSLYNVLKTVLPNVGYKMRFDKHITSSTTTCIYTDGTFLNELQYTDFDYVIVDEVHERTERTDLILGILRNRIKKEAFKLVLMSATVDIGKIQNYFNAITVEVEGMSYPVDLKYCENGTSDYIVEAYLVIKDICKTKEETTNRDILVFLPGEEDINELYKLLKKILVIKAYRVYSALSDAAQNKIYESCMIRKVILSTNICETSLTIPGVRYVIDTGLHKAKIHDKVSYLGIQPISKESAKQRMGRCNRTGPGVCYRLYSEESYNSLKSSVPEICRIDLSRVFLSLIGYEQDIFKFEFLDYPTISNAVLGLKLLLDKECIEIFYKIEDKAVLMTESLFEQLIDTKKRLCDEENSNQVSKKPSKHSKDGVTNNSQAHVYSIPDFDDHKNVFIRITNYGKILQRHPFDVCLAHFYQQCIRCDVPYFGSLVVSLIAQENFNFIRNSTKPDLAHLVDLMDGYLSAEDKSAYCTSKGVSEKGMERGKMILSSLNRKKVGDIELLYRVFSSSFRHNKAVRQENGSYRHLSSGNEVWVHPQSIFSKKQDKSIVFVDIIYTSKMYTRIVGKWYK